MSVFDAGMRSTGQFEVMSKSQLSVRETMLLLFSMILNAMPAIIAGCLWAWYLGSVYNSVAGDVLDVLHEQPTGWAAEGFNYKTSGSRFPPGPGPHVGADVVYGSRQDLVDTYGLSTSWESQPSVSYRLMLRGYHGVLIPGHPNIGIESLWKTVSPLMISRLGMFMASTLIMNALFWDKLKGSRGHWLLGVYGVVLAVLIDCWLIAGAVAAGKPREGALTNLVPLWSLVHTIIVYYNAKYNCGLVGAFRGILGPMLVTNITALVHAAGVGRMLDDTASSSGGAMLLIRLIVWPLLAEAVMAPTRMMLRSIPDDWANKYGLTFAMIPQMLMFCVLGRVFQYKITDPGLMTVCNFGLFFVEMLFRLTVAHRDRAYARALACMSHAGVKQLFGQKNNVKFRCDNLCNEMLIEYFAMFAVFTQMSYVRKTTNPDEPFDMGMIVLNLIMQVGLEGLCDCACLYIEIVKLKAPVLNAWKGRRASYPFVWGTLAMAVGSYVLLSGMSNNCAMYTPEKQLIWMNCN